MALTDLQVFDQTLQTYVYDSIAQNIDGFNAASGNALILSGENFSGDFLKQSFFTSLSAAHRRVDRYAARSAVSSIPLAQAEKIDVKIAGGFDPIEWAKADLDWIMQDQDQSIDVVSQQIADIMTQDMINSTIAMLVAAISNQAAATNDVSGTGGITQTVIADTRGKFGDKQTGLSLDVMRGATYTRLVKEAINNSNTLFSAENVTIVNIQGQRILMIDAPSLYESGTPNKEKILHLTSGAGMCRQGDYDQNIQKANGKTVIETTFQADYTFGLGCKGYSWDDAAGGKSPTDAEIATGSNWDLVTDDIKNSAGAISIGDADAA